MNVQHEITRRWTRHPLYKESGSAWMREVPSTWEVCKAQRIGRMLKGVGGTKEDVVSSGVPCVRYGDLYTTHDYTITAARTFVSTERAAEYTPIRFGDVLFAASGETYEEIGKSAVNLILSPACCGGDIVVLRPSIPTHAAFLGYYFDCRFAAAQKASMGKGTTVKHIYPSELNNLLVFLPPLPEQRSIAAHLDRKTAEIEAVIAAKERMIALLQEQRQALVSRAVTRGVDPSVPTKDPGVEWLDLVPAHWAVERLKFSLSLLEQGWSPQCDSRLAEGDEWGVLKVGCVNGNDFDPSEQKALPAGVEPEARYEIRPGDILLSRGNTRELVGSASLVREVRPRLLLCDLLYRLRVRPDRADAEYLVHQLRSRSVRFQIERDASGTSNSMKKIGQETIREFIVCLPPVQEQKKIVAHIRREARRIDGTVKTITDQDAKLREYRQTLISAAVTGQLDLRQEAAP